VNDRVAWSVGLSVGLSPSKPCRKFASDRDTVCVQDLGGPRERPITYSGPLRVNTVLCSFTATSYVRLRPSMLPKLQLKLHCRALQNFDDATGKQWR